ncbi:unnamed protein product [Sphenostylis stenocarpa]|uniref:Uncharacterized protein n=1 Tax=Sphenostylis stenocarpa TaxID=92480 RepID=A0AA86ST34_9FABA|nr:unnamed protein product [Sphenostylis stenocarpa]
MRNQSRANGSLHYLKPKLGHSLKLKFSGIYLAQLSSFGLLILSFSLEKPELLGAEPSPQNLLDSNQHLCTKDRPDELPLFDSWLDPVLVRPTSEGVLHFNMGVILTPFQPS